MRTKWVIFNKLFIFIEGNPDLTFSMHSYCVFRRFPTRCALKGFTCHQKITAEARFGRNMFGFFPKHQNVANLRSRCFNLFAGDVFTGKKFIQTLRDSKADCHSAVFFNVGFTSQTRKKKTPSRRGGSLRTRTAVLSLGAVSTLGAKLLGREKGG